MKKIRLLLTLFFVSICAVQSAWADRSAPELPAAQDLVSGTSYYLYNVVDGKFACRSITSNSYAAIGTYGEKVIITATANENEYTIQWASNNHYWQGYDTYVSSSTNSTSKYNKFTISKSAQGYTIQRSPTNNTYYKADEFLGFDGSNGDRITPALAEGSIQWQLMSVDDAEYYFAKHKLYTYLGQADQYNFYITQYEQVYNNPASTTEELDFAQSTLQNALEVSTNYVSPSWTEYPILFQNITEDKWEKGSEGLYLHTKANGAIQTSTLKATVNVDENATLAYTYYSSSSYTNLRIYLDGELVQNISNNQSHADNGSIDVRRRYYIEMTPGKHDISWTCVCNDSRTGGNYHHYSYLNEIGIQNTPTIVPATTTVEGQLGTEVLKLIDPISKVKKIVITGVIGADDWTTIGLMVNAFSIDMSGATATAGIPKSMFTKSKFPFLHSMKLPQGLPSIGDYAFQNSDIEGDITFPATLTSIGYAAFQHTKITGAYMSEGLTSLGSYAFCHCYYLENATWPASAATIPYYCFQDDYNLRTFDIPEGVQEIQGSAFNNCWTFNPRFPNSLRNIGGEAFYNTATDELHISEKMTVGNEAFSNCKYLTYAEWPTTFSAITSLTNQVVRNCPKLSTVKLMSPTVVTYPSQDFFYGNTLGNITLLVPDFLVDSYKLDPYWYKCNVEGFSSADITDWQVTQPLTLNAGQRIGGTPNLLFKNKASLTVSGDDVQTIGNMNIYFSPIQFEYYVTNYGWKYLNQHYDFMLSNTNKVNITGKLTETVFTNEKTWYFLTMPFDMKVGDIVAKDYVTGTVTSFAIRYYDGASRATNGNSGNWRNYTAEDIIPAGTGFIYQTAKAATSSFIAQNNASKQYILSNNEFVKALAANPSEVTANKGWNLVGNPWQTYYNIHKLNFTAPITVWDMDKKQYAAYSIIDDDYAIKPLEAIFVQCPDEVSSISFPIDGRQLTNKIESQSAAPAFGEAANTRRLIDIELTDGEQSDKTRFVLNPNAKMDYETCCDASKFFSLDASVPQIYTIQNGVQMAINERPANDGIVKLGIKIPAQGTYTIKSERNDMPEAVLVDNQNGTETTLTAEGYTFTADAGSVENRFELHLISGNTTGIENLNQSHAAGEGIYFNMNGQRVDALQKGIYIVNGKKVIIK